MNDKILVWFLRLFYYLLNRNNESWYDFFYYKEKFQYNQVFKYDFIDDLSNFISGNVVVRIYEISVVSIMFYYIIDLTDFSEFEIDKQVTIQRDCVLEIAWNENEKKIRPSLSINEAPNQFAESVWKKISKWRSGNLVKTQFSDITPFRSSPSILGGWIPSRGEGFFQTNGLRPFSPSSTAFNRRERQEIDRPAFVSRKRTLGDKGARPFYFYFVRFAKGRVDLYIFYAFRPWRMTRTKIKYAKKDRRCVFFEY